MKAICKKNIGKYPSLVLPEDSQNLLGNDNYISSNDWYTINADVSGYCLTIEKTYLIYGVLRYDNQIRYLVADDQGIPCFMPENLFEITDSATWEWEEKHFKLIESEISIFISNDLVSSYDDLISLLRLDDKAIKQFLKYKKFIEDYFL